MIYDLGAPNDSVPTHELYVDLETDTMYELRAGSWVIIMKNGKPVDERGNVIEEHLYY